MNDSTLPRISFSIDGTDVEVDDDGSTLLDVLRGHGCVSAKDGCSPQGQCGCCTVLVDGAPRIACVTPARRMKGRSVVTVDGLDPDRRDAWTDAFVSTGASQCGFCTPGIVCRLEGAAAKGADLADRAVVDKALLAHVCRCTGWQTIREAAVVIAVGGASPAGEEARDLDAAAARAELEGGAPQSVGADVVLGRGGFSADTAPVESLVAVPAGDGWAVAASLAAARVDAGKIQGRRTTVSAAAPIALPAGDWDRSLRTNWLDPAYLETDVAWCSPGGEPSGPLANGGAFAPKTTAWLGDVARELAAAQGQTVKVVLDREDVVQRSPKRPPLALGVRRDGTALLRIARTEGAADVAEAWWPGIEVEQVDVLGPPTSMEVRGALAVELAMARSVPDHAGNVRVDDGSAWASAHIDEQRLSIVVHAGRALDEVVLRSYVIGAAHQALGLVRSESIAVDGDGTAHDLTIRSLGVLRSVDTPEIVVEIVPSDDDPVACSVAVMAAVAAVAWHQADRPSILPLSSN